MFTAKEEKEKLSVKALGDEEKWRDEGGHHAESISSFYEAKERQSKYEIFFSTALQILPDKKLTVTKEIFCLASF